ncbi:serpentine type 7TM GPCR chemoreceptor str domain-containing protein [Ditylenchus destructor]|nr:serpentine type 7TM GPCR chemoreceptor str domain-containing protein [Ditylenchus destructor]
MDTIHHVTDTSINSISVFLNEYKYLLTVASINDIILGFAILYGQPAVLLADGYYAFVPNGFFANKSWLADYLAGTLMGILVHAYIVCVALQFVYRYRFMSRDSRQHKDKFVLVKFVLFPFLYTSVHAIITIWMAYQPPEFAQMVKHIMEANQWPIREDQKFYAAGARINDLKTILYTASYIITISGGYATPGPITAFMTTVATLITLANPITTICIVKPYRRAFLRIFGFGNKIGASSVAGSSRERSPNLNVITPSN